MEVDSFDLVEFNKVLLEIKHALSSSPTKGLSIFQSMWLYKDDKTILEGLIESLKVQVENSDKKDVLENFIKNLEFIRVYVLNRSARASVEAIQESLVHEINNNYNLLQA